MALSGTSRTVLSEETMKGSSVSSVMKALTDANKEAIKAEKKGKKAKK